MICNFANKDIVQKFIVSIPFYKNEYFIENFISWYNSSESESDKVLISEVIVFNDCPHSEGAAYLKSRCLDVGFIYLVNAKNIGYLKTVNLAYYMAREKACSLILLNSDTIPLPGFISEINKCFHEDRMLGVVSARSNNATICNLYDEPDYIGIGNSTSKYKNDIKKFSRYTPQISYTPVVTGFCFAIQNRVIEIFDGFDEVFTVGYEEENEYCLRISERGFRVGVANRAFVAHMEGRSFALTKTREKIKHDNAIIIRNKYDYYDALIDDYSLSLDKRAQSFISKSLKNRKTLLIDARVLSPCHNGSNKYIVEFLKAIANFDLMADVVIDKNAAKFHALDELKNLFFITAVDEVYEYGFTLGQPMHHSALYLIPSHTLISTCIFFDTIAHDCPQLRASNKSLDSLWSLLPYIYSDISFISEHSLRQFKLKFGIGTSELRSHLLPMYFKDKNAAVNGLTGSVLIFGNKFLHKGQDLLLQELNSDEATKYFVLGPRVDNAKSNIIFLAPGETEEDELHLLMQSVDYILMPSFSEGFGFPLLEAVSYGKTIYCRDIDCYREIISTLPAEKANLIKLVANFKAPLVPLDLGNYNTTSKYYKNYEEYVLDVYSDAGKKCSEEFFSLLKIRLQLIPSMDPTSSVEISITKLKKIYRFLLRTPFGGVVRYLKNLAFEYQFLRKFMK